jgi:hypothetical protein
MTAMRVLKANIEREISQLGAQSFAVRKWPAIYFGGPEGFEKYWRRQNITLAHGKLVEEKATLADSVGVEGNFWGGQVETRYQKTPPTVQLLGETPGSFPARAASGSPISTMTSSSTASGSMGCARRGRRTPTPMRRPDWCFRSSSRPRRR